LQQETDQKRPTWIAAAVSQQAFEKEQQELSKLWNFVGYVSDIPDNGDWFTTTLGRKSIFVQRDKDRIVAFENKCVHRFYPLRTKEKGNGPIVCDFHHWRYNATGEAVGIPKSIDLFGAKPKELCKKLNALDIDTCGDLIFARFPDPSYQESLKEYLGDGYGLIATLGLPRISPYRFTQDVPTHWKFLHHISLDDYHLVAVHPDTFGKSGYLKSETVQYFRFGRHSAFFHTAEATSLSDVSSACMAGTFQPRHYMIVNIFPNFLISFYDAKDIFGTSHWYASAIRYQAMEHNRTLVQSWLYPTTFTVPQKPVSAALKPIIDRVMPSIVAFYAKKIMREDNTICAGLQATAHQIQGEQLLGRFEKRIGWFEEAYGEMLGEIPEPEDFQNIG
jgi:phenylpropionate dioxygenase-like ring-hydroxylating dioxygenase large terminal subunit